MTRLLLKTRHHERPLAQSDRVSASLLVSAVVTALTLGLAFGLLGLGIEYFWVVYPLGFGVILPSALGFVNYHWTNKENLDNNSSGIDSGDRLKALRKRYVRGDISEAEFERQLDRLLEISETQ